MEEFLDGDITRVSSLYSNDRAGEVTKITISTAAGEYTTVEMARRRRNGRSSKKTFRSRK